MKHLTELLEEQRRFHTRRWFFRDCGVGLGGIALASLLGQDKALGASSLLTGQRPHFAPKA